MSFQKVSIDQAYQYLLSLKDSKGQIKNPVIALQCRYMLAYKEALSTIGHLEKHELLSRPFIDSPSTRLILNPCGEKQTPQP
jgi:hypothetical protein